jgi:hypothetical protein
MRTMIAIQTVMLAMSLSLPGCDDAKEDKAKKPTAAADKAKDEPKADPGKDKSAAGGLAAATDDTAPDADADADPLAGIDKRVVRAAALAKKIEAEPEKAGDILDAAGLQRDEFEDLIFEISADASLAKQYQAAMVAQTG